MKLSTENLDKAIESLKAPPKQIDPRRVYHTGKSCPFCEVALCYSDGHTCEDLGELNMVRL